MAGFVVGNPGSEVAISPQVPRLRNPGYRACPRGFVASIENRCDPMSICQDIFTVRPRMADVRRAAPGEIRSALPCVKHHLTPANASGLEDVIGRGGKDPLGGTSLLLMAAQTCGAGSRAEQEAMEPIDRIRLSRTPHIKFKHLLGPGAQGMGRALDYFRRVAEGTDGVLVRASANGREYICEATRILFTTYASNVKGSAPPTVFPEGMAAASGIARALSRIERDAARSESSVLRVFDAHVEG